jgi:anti-anti-sigma regulatory factor
MFNGQNPPAAIVIHLESVSYVNTSGLATLIRRRTAIFLATLGVREFRAPA